MIWWTDQGDSTAIDEVWGEKYLPPDVPDYLRDEYRSSPGTQRAWSALGESCAGPARGRAGRRPGECLGRPLGRRLARDCAGIVLLRSDLPALATLPGIVTDLHLRRLETIAKTEEVLHDLRAERDRLYAAIVRHRDQKADDLCWKDNDELYAAAGLPPRDHRIGDPEAMFENCKRFIAKSCMAGGPWVSYRELEEENRRLKALLGIPFSLSSKECPGGG